MYPLLFVTATHSWCPPAAAHWVYVAGTAANHVSPAVLRTAGTAGLMSTPVFVCRAVVTIFRWSGCCSTYGRTWAIQSPYRVVESVPWLVAPGPWYGPAPLYVG